MSEDTHNSENKLEWPDVMGIGPNYQSELTKLREQVKELREAIEPFALASEETTGIGSIPPEKTWLWKPCNNLRDTHGISLKHCQVAREIYKRTNPNADVKQAFPKGRFS